MIKYKQLFLYGEKMDIVLPIATSWTYPVESGKTRRMYLYGKKMAADNNASENHRPKTLYVNTVCTLFVNKKAPF